MLRPLLIDLLLTAFPLVGGALAFFLGSRAQRSSPLLRAAAPLVAVFFIALRAIDVVGIASVHIRPLFYWVGGGSVALCWAALFLLGYTSKAPGKRFSQVFLIFLGSIACLLLGVESTGPMWWRYVAPGSWNRIASADGCLTQSNGLTCAPVSAVMLLHYYGIETSEGEMAYLSGTSLLGTDAYALSRAIDTRLDAHERSAVFELCDYDTCVRTKSPFVAAIRRPGVGSHAVFVESITETEVVVIDPLAGRREVRSRADFVSEWQGVVVRVVGYEKHD